MVLLSLPEVTCIVASGRRFLVRDLIDIIPVKLTIYSLDHDSALFQAVDKVGRGKVALGSPSIYIEGPSEIFK